MLKPKIAALALALTASFVWNLGTVSAGTLSAPQETITITGKKPARFNHQTHLKLGLTCGRCHHDAAHKPRTAKDIAALGDATQLKCATCHNSNFANPKLQKRMSIFHARCRECHKAGINGKKGPTNCSACHIKQKKAVEGC